MENKLNLVEVELNNENYDLEYEVKGNNVEFTIMKDTNELGVLYVSRKLGYSVINEMSEVWIAGVLIDCFEQEIEDQLSIHEYLYNA